MPGCACGWSRRTSPSQDAAAAATYRERVGIITDALALRRPARVPICPLFGVYPLAY